MRYLHGLLVDEVGNVLISESSAQHHALLLRAGDIGNDSVLYLHSPNRLNHASCWSGLTGLLRWYRAWHWNNE